MQRLLLLELLVGAGWLLLGAHAFFCPAAGPWHQQRRQSPLARRSSSRRQGAALALFDFFGGGGGGKKAAAEIVAEDNTGLTPAAARRAIKIQDSGTCPLLVVCVLI